jgi:hypothetical protein
MRTGILTNHSNLGLTMSLWLADDNYDHEPANAPQDEHPIISVTDLLKPTRALVLAHRVPDKEASTDLQNLVAARIGQSLHDAIERGVKSEKREAIMKALGYPEKVAGNLRINPSDEELAADPEIIAFYIEKRAYRLIQASNGTKIWISGKFDQVIDGRVEDNKTVSSYKYTKMDSSESGEFSLQQGIYRWLNPELILSDVGKVNFIIKDWKRSDAARIPGYPPTAVCEMPVQLMSHADVDVFVRRKLDEILAAVQIQNEADLPECAEEDLWKSPDTHKYYKNPETLSSGGRSTKNFDSYPAAMQYKAQQGGVGIVSTVIGEVRRCSYCDAAPLCTQRLQYKTE